MTSKLHKISPLGVGTESNHNAESNMPQIDEQPKSPTGQNLLFIAVCIVLIICVTAGYFGISNYLSGYEVQVDEKVENVEGMLANYVTSSELQGVKNSINYETKTLKDSTSNISDTLNRLDTKLNEQRDTINNLTTRLDTNDQQFGEIKEKIQSIITKINTPSTKTSSKSTDRFNLDVDGIGVWNGRPFLSIGYRGKYVMVEEGQIVNGWQLVEIDAVNRKAQFKFKTGIIYKLSI